MEVDDFFSHIHGSLGGPTAGNVKIAVHDTSDREHPSSLIVATQEGEWDGEKSWAFGVWFPQVRYPESAAPDFVHGGTSLILHVTEDSVWVDWTSSDGLTIQEFKIRRADDEVYELGL